MAKALSLATGFLLVASCELWLSWAHPVASNAPPASGLTPEELEFFESKIRPLLIERCYSCHSDQFNTTMGDLRLDTREGWVAGGSRGTAILPGKPSESLLIQAISYQHPDLSMPPQGPLSPEEIELLEQWVGLGAPDPRTEGLSQTGEKESIDLEEGRQFWSFQPISQPQLPSVQNSGWVRSPIDRFILARLEAEGLEPVGPADRRTWIRRSTFDLIGLPPTPEEVEIFLSDDAPEAFDKVVDRLLASPHYGERWGRYWLDVARYAEEQRPHNSGDYQPLPFAYRYRDWVVKALNRDLPYDRFAIQQIAGDLIEELGEERWSAVGYLSLGPIYETDGGGEESKLRHRYETINDKVDTLSRGFLGLTLACARCHDHKFDPIPTEDYYSLAGVFFNTEYVARKWLVGEDEVDRYVDFEARLTDQTKCLEAAENKRDQASDPAQKKELEEKVQRLTREVAQLQKVPPSVPEHVHTLTEGGNEDIPVAVRGDPVQPGGMVPRRFLRVIAGDDPPRFTQGSGRLELARAVATPTNPLTARVMVNRIWQNHFGQGLVRTPSNFGALGEPPTHLELLDWLAQRFIQSGWSMKKLHKEIMLSTTYRLSSDFDDRNFAADGENQLLWRVNPRRLDVEAWRDGLLAVTGELDPSLGGPPVENILTSGRRTLYAPIRRDDRFDSDKFLRLFDFPSPWLTSSQRTVTTMPQQQLFMLNSKFMIERSRALATRLTALAETERLTRAFELAFSRRPSAREKGLALDFLRESKDPSASLNRWEQYAQVLLSSSELLYIR